MLIVVGNLILVPLLLLQTGPAPSPEAGPAANPVVIEHDMARLQRTYDERLRSEDWDGVLAVIREGLSLDADHPVPWRQAVLMLRRRGDVDGDRKLLDSLGPSDGPGRRYGEGIALFLDKHQEEAAGAFGRALRLYEQRGHVAGRAACLTALGNLDREAGRLEEALERYQAAADQLELIQDRVGQADVAANQARVERMLGRPRLALEKHRRILAIREELDDKPGQSKSWHEIGQCLFEDKDLAGARAAFDKALSMRRSANDNAGEGTTLRRLADVAAGMEKDRDALDYLIAAEAAFSESKDRAGRAENMAELGKTLRRLGEYERARGALESARTLSAELKDRKLQAGIQADMAAVAYALWDIPAALAAAEQAIDWFREAKNTRGELACLDTLGALHNAVGNLPMARRHLESRQAIAERLNDPDLRAIGHNNLGVVLGRMGESEAALDHFDRAEKLWQELGHQRRLGFLQCNRAELLAGQGQSEKARALLEQALGGFRERHEIPGQALALNQLGALEAARGRYQGAVARHTAALELARRQGLAEEEWRAHIGLAASLQSRGRRQEALQAIDKVETVRAGLLGDAFKMRFLAGRMDLYERAISILLAGRKPGDRDAAPPALQVVQRAKARGLLDLLGESRFRMRDKLPPELRQREQAGLDAISAATVRLLSAKDDAQTREAREALERAEGQFGRLEIEIRAAAPGYAEIAFPRPASARDVQASLGEKETLLEYFVGSHDAWVWEVTPKHVEVHPLPSPSLIRDAVAAYLKSAAAPGAALAGDAKDPAAERLATMILSPVRLEPGGRLLVAPDGPLHHVPFEALVTGGRFLIEDHDVQTVPSATAMLWMRSSPPSRAAHAFLGVGNPAAPDASLALPYSGAEIEAIASLFDAPAKRVMLGEQLSRAAFTEPSLKDFRYVHFATHGLLNEGAPGDVRTGLWLGRRSGEKTDAILTLPDVATLPLDADLVVLSACRSGEGELLDGEGIVGLTRAFLQAGARSVVMALWNVSDQSSVDLMHAFYRGLTSGATPGAALRQAKLEFIRSDRPARREPYRWDPFVLVGTDHR